ncbi:hypothetical protein PF272_02660, partial [Gallibacterium sp. AGMB14963]|nr:hypothetical protein [Gallibacterium sp. AGMB14963]
ASGTFTSASGNINVTHKASEGDNKSTLEVKLANELSNITSIGSGAKTGATFSADEARISFTKKAGSMTAPAISMNKAKVTNVANGTIDTTSGDAINGNQLNAALESIKTALGGTAQNGNGTVTAPTDIGGTGKNNVNDAIAALNNKVGGGLITFEAEGPSSGKTVTKTFGQTLSFTTVDDSTDTTFKGANIATAIKDGKVNIAIKQVASADDVKGTLPTDGTGGGLVTAEVLKTYVTDQVGNGKLSYKAKGETPARSVALSTGLTFNGDDNLTPSTKADTGDVTYALNSVLKNITSIGSGKNVANETEARLSFHSATAGTTPTAAYIEANGVVNVKLNDKLTGITSITGPAGTDGNKTTITLGNKTVDVDGARITNIGHQQRELMRRIKTMWIQK